MSYGEPGQGTHAWSLGLDDSRPFFQQAIEAGITTFDTANVYSLGSSEEITGQLLREFAKRDEAVIATKVHGRMFPGPKGGGLSRAAILTAIDDSLRRLGTDYIDLYQVHRWDPGVPIEETMEALHDIVRAGKARYIGASSMWAWQFAQAQHAADLNGWTRFVSMQDQYNLLQREEEREMMPFCRAMGIGVIPWSPLARGLLTRPRPSGASVRTDDSARSASDQYSIEIYEGTAQWDVVDAVERIATLRGVTMAEVGLAWLLARPGLTAPIVGATKLAHLDAAIRAVELTLSAAEIAAIDAPYRAQPVRGHED